MALGLLAALRNSMLDEITALIDAQAGAGFARLYDSTRPATGGSATTLLAEMTFSVTSAAAASSGVLTFSSITDDSSANATGTVTWFRVVDASATFVFDGDVATSGSDMNIDSTTINAGQVVSITSWTITAGNP